MTDAQLLARTAAGDSRAFSTFAARHGSWLLALLQRFGLHRADAEDTAQQALLKAYEAAGRYDAGRAEPRAWLSTIALNLARNQRRGAERRELATARLRSQVDSRARQEPSALMERAQRRAQLRDALLALGPEDRALVMMRVDLQQPFAHIARELGITPSAARQRFHRAVQKLKEQVKP